MLKKIALFLFIFIWSVGFAQDTITVRSIQAAITEINKGNLINIGLFEDKSTTFPEDFFTIPKEKVIGLLIDNCSYTSLPIRLKEYTNLTHFAYAWFYLGVDCPLSTFPLVLTEISSLRSINFEGAKFASIPPLTGLTKLESLRLWMCELPEFPRNVLEMTNLTTLDLSCNKFTAIPDDIDRLKNLKVLDFEGGACGATPISYVPNTIGNLTLLEEFGLGYTEIPVKTLPASFYTLQNLKRFDCHGCGLTILSEEIGNLRKLEDLNLTNIDYFQEFPEAFFTLPNLKSFDFYQYSESADPELLKQEKRIKEWGKNKKEFSFWINIGGR